MRTLLMCGLLGLVFAACQPEESEGWAPVARFTVAPLYVPAGVVTEVTLDGRRSCDALDNPELCDNSEEGPGCPDVCPGGISYSWSVPGKVGGVIPDVSSGALVRVNVQIDSPVKISLTVTDCDGLSSTKSMSLGVTD